MKKFSASVRSREAILWSFRYLPNNGSLQSCENKNSAGQEISLCD